jgi:hypothetical protein
MVELCNAHYRIEMGYDGKQHYLARPQKDNATRQAAILELARAIVFSYNSRKDEALQLLARWRENGLPQQPEAAQPDAGQLKTIIEQYAEMNMHPRAFELLREFGDTPESQLKITAPPPLRPEAIAEVKQKMRVGRRSLELRF